jgi:cyclophilin family peptidyl-prolyl cis-trans isomerase
VNKFLSFLAIGLACTVTACTAETANEPAAPAAPPATEAAAPGPVAKPAPIADPLVDLTTSKGVITVRLYQKQAPITAGNFLDLVKRGFYKDMVFHRVVPGFVIQTGDPTGTGQGGFIDPKTNEERTIKLETSPELKHDAAGVLSMARTPDPDSASSQFYITLDATPNLDGGYAVFGRVVKGLDVVKKIQQGDKFISAKLVVPAKAKPAPAKPAATKP